MLLARIRGQESIWKQPGGMALCWVSGEANSVPAHFHLINWTPHVPMVGLVAWWDPVSINQERGQVGSREDEDELLLQLVLSTGE